MSPTSSTPCPVFSLPVPPRWSRSELLALFEALDGHHDTLQRVLTVEAEQPDAPVLRAAAEALSLAQEEVAVFLGQRGLLRPEP